MIAGAGEAGVSAAGALRAAGYDGDVVLLNAEAALPYERPPLSKDVLLDHATQPKLIQDEAWYRDHGIKLLNATHLIGIDPVARVAWIETAPGASEGIPYAALMFATGARPRRLAAFGDDVTYLRTLKDGQLLRLRLDAATRIAVIGAGVIGLEVASTARALGKQVAVIDVAPRMMARAVAPEVSELLLDLHRAAGVDVHLDVGNLARHEKGVRLGDGQLIEADLIVAGIGVIPNSEIAEATGCRVDNGVLVDHRGETSVPGIFAAGDVAAFPHPTFQRAMRVEAWQHAGRHGAHVGRAMLGIDDEYCEIPWFWTDQHGMNVQVVGVAEGATTIEWRGDPTRGTALHFAGDRLVAATTINNGRDIRPLTKLIASGLGTVRGLLNDESRPLGKIVSDILAEQTLEASAI